MIYRDIQGETCIYIYIYVHIYMLYTSMLMYYMTIDCINDILAVCVYIYIYICNRERGRDVYCNDSLIVSGSTLYELTHSQLTLYELYE